MRYDGTPDVPQPVFTRQWTNSHGVLQTSCECQLCGTWTWSEPGAYPCAPLELHPCRIVGR